MTTIDTLRLHYVWVPPGPFSMGSDEKKDPLAYENEFPRHRVTLPGYWIGCYPVTEAQFRAFVEVSDYRPSDEDDPRGRDDHPVVRVTWYDAMAFCNYLSEQMEILVTLPSEAQWEKAARGVNGYIYPWGDELPDEHRCNFGDRNGTTPVGKYSPDGDSPYGCTDMAGNVWEWTRSLWGKNWEKPDFEYPYDPGDGRENLEAGSEALRVLRGGAFFYGARSVRCACRGRFYPSNRFISIGFRVIVAV